MPAYQRHENFWSDFKIYRRIIWRSIKAGFAVHIIVLSILMYSTLNSLNVNIHNPTNGVSTYQKIPTESTLKYFMCVILNSNDESNEFVFDIEKELTPYSMGNNSLPPYYYRILVNAVSLGNYEKNIEKLSHDFKWSFLSYLASIIYLFIFFSRTKKNEEEKYIRGSQLIPTKIFQKITNRIATHPLSLEIANIKIPHELETKHMLILGASGSGKGVLINQLVAQINDRKIKHKTTDRIIYYDPKGEFLSKQFKKNDIIFNPFDSRSIGWSLTNEIFTTPDLDVVSQSLFSTSDATNKYFYDCAADVFRAGLVYLIKNQKTTNADLWDFFAQPLDGMISALKTLPAFEQGAINHIAVADSPATGSIISVLQQRIKAFRYLVGMDSDFSFRKFIRDGKNQNLFILNANQNFSEIFKPLLTLVIDLMTREALSLPDNANRRIFFVVDELGTLDKMPSILDLLTVGRSKGACLICANQDLGRVEEKYGKANLKTFFNNFNINFIFNVKDPETTKFLSAAVGDQQIIKTSSNLQVSKDGKSINEQEKTEALILPSQFQNLPSLHAYISISGYGVSQIVIPPTFYSVKHPPSLEREFDPIMTSAESINTESVIQDTEAESDQQISHKKIKKFNI